MKKLFLIPIIGIALMLAGCLAETEEKMEKPKKDVDKAKVAILVGEGFHDGEAYMPLGYLTNKGYKVVVIGPEKGIVTAYNSDFTIKIEKAVEDVSVDWFEALILPGGQAPADLRENEAVVEFVKEFFETGKTVAAICHGPQILVRAGVIEGKTATCFEGMKDEYIEANVEYVDESVVIDENLITSRTPPDLYDFSRAIAKSIKSEDWKEKKEKKVK